MASKHLLTDHDYYYPVGVCIEGILFGFYTAIFIAALWIWDKRRSRRSTPSTFPELLYLYLIVLMWITACLHFGISIQRFLRIYIMELKLDSLPPAIRLLDARRWDTLAHMLLMTIMIWLGDILVLYRTFVLWNKSKLVIALPILVHVAYLVVNTIAIYELSHPDIIARKAAVAWYQPVFPLVFAQNVLTTGLLSYKVWIQHRSSKANGVSNANGTVGLGRLAWMMIETAMLYTIELFIIIVLGALQHPAKGIASVSLVPSLGIVFVLLSVRIHFGGKPGANGSMDLTATLGNLPDLTRESVSDKSIERGRHPSLSGAVGSVNREVGRTHSYVDEVDTQHSDFEDQESYPTISV